MMLYIDPGTGSMLFSLATGLLSAVWFGARKLYMNTKYFARGKTKTGDRKIPLAIYSDDKRYWQVFEPICRELNDRKFDVTYLTASPDDPALGSGYPYLHAEFIGEGNKQFIRMNFLNACIVLSTTPGLDVYQWKRSKAVDYYVHILHGISAAGYSFFGLDFYDAVILSAEFQKEEVRELEKKRGLPEKEIIKAGVPYWDEMMMKINGSKSIPEHETTVLLAPSWREMGLLNRYGSKLIDILLSTGYHIIIRPHPQSFTSEKAMIDRLMSQYPDSDQLEWNRDVDNYDVLRRSDIMISDYSSVIFDFTFVYNKPVICTHIEWKNTVYDLEWLDERPGGKSWAQRTFPSIGLILTDDNLTDLKQMIDQSLTDQSIKTKRQLIRDEVWTSKGQGAANVASYLISKYKELTNNDGNGNEK